MKKDAQIQYNISQKLDIMIWYVSEIIIAARQIFKNHAIRIN